MPAELLSNSSLTYSGRVSPWHRMGIPMGDTQLTAVQALEKTQLDYLVEKQRPVILCSDGQYREASRNFILMRHPIPAHGRPDWEDIGSCSEQYEILQNRELCEILDQHITGKWSVDTLGALGRGDRFFITLNAGTWSVAGEEMQSYVSFLDDKKSDQALRVVLTDFAVVCSNTYQAADASAKISASIPHNKKMRENLQWKVSLFQTLQDHQRSFKEIAEHFAHTKVTSADVASVIADVYPLPTAPESVKIAADVDEKEKLTALAAKELLGANIASAGRVGGDPLRKYTNDKLRVLGLRDAVEREYDLTNQERPKIAGTAWALFNAFTGAIDHAPRGAHSNPASRSEAATIGAESRTKLRAFEVISTLSAN